MNREYRSFGVKVKSITIFAHTANTNKAKAPLKYSPFKLEAILAPI